MEDSCTQEKTGSKRTQRESSYSWQFSYVATSGQNTKKNLALRSSHPEMLKQPLHLGPLQLLTTAEEKPPVPPRHGTSSCNGISAAVSEHSCGVSP